jgi:Holliday junction resolvase RusA-like endonuclease
MPKPKSAAKKLVYPTTKPDVDKLARAVLDGLVAGGAMKDDAQVSMVIAEKRYAIDRAPGVVITMLKRQG